MQELDELPRHDLQLAAAPDDGARVWSVGIRHVVIASLQDVTRKGVQELGVTHLLVALETARAHSSELSPRPSWTAREQRTPASPDTAIVNDRWLRLANVEPFDTSAPAARNAAMNSSSSNGAYAPLAVTSESTSYVAIASADQSRFASHQRYQDSARVVRESS